METQITEPKESPVLETPATEGNVEPAVDHRANAEALLETLGKLKVDSPERLEGMAYASQQAGRYANDLGTTRQEVEALKAEINALKTPQQQPQPQYQQQYEGYDYGQPTTPQVTPSQISSLVGDEFRKVIGQYTKTQLDAQQQVLEAYSAIQNDPDYSMVQSVWDKHAANPKVQMAINARTTTPEKEFNRVKLAYYKGIAMNARDTVEGLLKQSPAATAPPHMEAGTTQVPGIPQPETNIDRMREIAKNTTGTDDDLEALLREALPDDDAFLQQPMEIKEGIIPRR